VHRRLPPSLDRRFEAVVFDWDGTAVPDRAADARELRALVEELTRLGLDLVVITGTHVGNVDGQLGARPAGPGRLYFCVNCGSEVYAANEGGLELVDARKATPDENAALDAAAEATVEQLARRGLHAEINKADAARWAFAELKRRGIGPGLVLIAGDEFGPLGGLPGSDSLLLVPEGARATAVTVGAEPTGAPADVIDLGGGPDAFLSILADQLERRRRGDVPDVDTDPDWTLVFEGLDPYLERVRESILTLADGRLGTRGAPLFDHPAAAPAVLHAGVYVGDGPATELAPCPDWTRVAPVRRGRPRLTRRLDLATGLLREEGPLTSLRFSSLARPATVALRAQANPALAVPRRRRRRHELVAMALRSRRRGAVLERLGAYDPDERAARTALAAAEEAGFEGLLSEHRGAWARRWEDADVIVEGDPDLQQAIRFALFHLMASVSDTGEAAVGARGLSGPAYRGHVFWDSDVFVLPFLAATHPEAARAFARAHGRLGARFPWESAEDGRDVTPDAARLATGQLVPIRTGELEEHITGDVAWAAAHYMAWTGDQEFASGPGRDLLVETARYWASRARFDQDGRAHIYGVIGPDEYHEPVDDNAFTNVLARWNLRQGAACSGVDGDERRTWLTIAERLVDGYDRASGLYEQFAGFFELEPLVIEEIAPRRPIAADLLLGAERTKGAQVLKQADVLMLHHLLPDEVAPGSLVPNLDFYEPRTAHGSSLSPAVNASVLARAGRYKPALESLQIAARLDLDDLTGTTAGGLHLATMGGLWQALGFGFGGIRPGPGALLVDPRLPREWNALEFSLRFRGRPLRLRIDRDGVSTTLGEWQVRQGDAQWEVTAG
jgi:trehalose/maltose hydrolase-like predicted phosphorylase